MVAGPSGLPASSLSASSLMLSPEAPAGEEVQTREEEARLREQDAADFHSETASGRDQHGSRILLAEER